MSLFIFQSGSKYIELMKELKNYRGNLMSKKSNHLYHYEIHKDEYPTKHLQFKPSQIITC